MFITDKPVLQKMLKEVFKAEVYNMENMIFIKEVRVLEVVNFEINRRNNFVLFFVGLISA